MTDDSTGARLSGAWQDESGKRKAAAEHLRAFLEERKPIQPEASDEEFEAAFLEAMRSVRPNFTPVS
jgi:hypothetical protein